MGKSVIIGIVAVIVIAGGGYLLLHKSSTTSTNNTSSSYSSPSTTNTTTPTTTSNAVIQTKTASNVGSYLADGSGRTLYTYGSDSTGVSNCTGSCLSAWPAYTATSSVASLPTNVSTLKRSDDGSTQYTYKGMPLYYFSSDSTGQVTGDGVSGFHVAKP